MVVSGVTKADIKSMRSMIDASNFELRKYTCNTLSYQLLEIANQYAKKLLPDILKAKCDDGLAQSKSNNLTN